MTPEEFAALPADTRKQIEELERLAKELMLDIGPPRAAELRRNVPAGISPLGRGRRI